MNNLCSSSTKFSNTDLELPGSTSTWRALPDLLGVTMLSANLGKLGGDLRGVLSIANITIFLGESSCDIPLIHESCSVALCESLPNTVPFILFKTVNSNISSATGTILLKETIWVRGPIQSAVATVRDWLVVNIEKGNLIDWHYLVIMATLVPEAS